MKPVIDSIIQLDVVDRLNRIPGAKVITGFYQHHLQDIQKRKSFPVIFVQSGDEAITGESAEGGAKLSREIKLLALVSTTSKDQVSSDLNEILYLMRSALFIFEGEKTKAMSVTTGNAKFDLPEAGDPFAFVELDVTLTYKEAWTQL